MVGGRSHQPKTRKKQTNKQKHKTTNVRFIESRCFLHRIIIMIAPHQHFALKWRHIDGLERDCSNSVADALELRQSCAKPSTWAYNNNKTLKAPTTELLWWESPGYTPPQKTRNAKSLRKAWRHHKSFSISCKISHKITFFTLVLCQTITWNNEDLI